LGTINSIDESLHAEHQSTGAEILPAVGDFSHSLGQKRTGKNLDQLEAHWHWVL